VGNALVPGDQSRCNRSSRYFPVSLRAGALIATALVLLVFSSGCAPTYYPYRAITNECNCEQYSIREENVEYLFHARYRMDGGVASEIDITLLNLSNDTLSLDLGAARVTSSNVAYQYNDKFLPLPIIQIKPHESDSIKLIGRDLSGKNDWLKIAGERLSVVLKGIRLGTRELPPQTVTFIPQNPKLEQR